MGSRPCPRSILPPDGFGVDAVIPASSSARELATPVWPLRSITMIGRRVGSRSRSSFVGWRSIPDGSQRSTDSQPSGSWSEVRTSSLRIAARNFFRSSLR